MKQYRLSLSTRAILLAAGASLAMPAMAEDEGAAATAAVADQPAADPAPSTADDDYDDLDGDEIVVTARSRSGQLIMTDAVIDGIRTAVVIDTGAEGSIGNLALLRAMGRRGAALQPTALGSVTGQTLPAELALARRLTIQQLNLDNVLIAFADAPPFAHLGLDRRPAMLLGMRELQAFARIAIDFRTRRILFDLPERPKDRALREMAAAWSPWRSVAARVLWAYYHVMKNREGIR